MNKDNSVPSRSMVLLLAFTCTIIFSICCYDFCIADKNNIEGIVYKEKFYSGRGRHTDIFFMNGKRYTVNSYIAASDLHEGDHVKIQQSVIFHRPLKVFVQDRVLKTALFPNNILFFVFLVTSGVGAIGCFLALLTDKIKVFPTK